MSLININLNCGINVPLKVCCFHSDIIGRNGQERHGELSFIICRDCANNDLLIAVGNCDGRPFDSAAAGILDGADKIACRFLCVNAPGQTEGDDEKQTSQPIFQVVCHSVIPLYFGNRMESRIRLFGIRARAPHGG